MLDRETQLAEAASREAERRTSEIESPPEVEAETTGPSETSPHVEAVDDSQIEQPAPRPMLLKDTKREEIVARFKTQRQQEKVDGEDDAARIRRFANQGLPPEL